jgi:hypothetical protein
MEARFCKKSAVKAKNTIQQKRDSGKVDGLI